MTRAIPAALCLIAVGCTNLSYVKVRDLPTPPPVATAGGTVVQVRDERPGWEKKPFQDAVALYPLANVSPGFWGQLQAVATTCAAESPEPLAHVELVVRSVQLVSKDADRLQRESERRTVASPELDEEAGLGQAAADLLLKPLVAATLNEPFRKRYPAALANSPDGVSCTLLAEVRLRGGKGGPRVIPLSVVATTDNRSGTRYEGEAVDEVVRLMTKQLELRLRQALSAPGRP